MIHKYVLAIVDNLTKFTVIRATKDTKTTSAIRILEKFVREYGAPTRIITDRGTCFTARRFEEFCERHGIRHTLNSPRHPQANGQVERLNAALVPAIQSNLVEENGRRWDKNLRKIQNDLNEMTNASTDKSPFELVYGYLPRREEGELRKLTRDDESTYCRPKKLQAIARERVLSEQNKMKERHDRNRIRNVDLVVGSIVYMKTAAIATGESTKLSKKYRAPLVVTEKLPGDTYRVSDLKDSARGTRYATTAHVSQLKAWEPENLESDDQLFDRENDLDTSQRDDNANVDNKAQNVQNNVTAICDNRISSETSNRKSAPFESETASAIDESARATAENAKADPHQCDENITKSERAASAATNVPVNVNVNVNQNVKVTDNERTSASVERKSVRVIREPRRSRRLEVRGRATN